MIDANINCFEARQEFPAFWRQDLSAERRSALVKHLAGCQKCDRAFRNFAVSAPVLHSLTEPERRLPADRSGPRGAQSRRSPGVSRSEFQPRRAMAMSAAAMVLIAASLAAYFSATTPVDTLSDELTADPVATQMLGVDLNSSGEDLAG